MKARMPAALRLNQVGKKRSGLAVEFAFHLEREVDLVGVARRQVTLDGVERAVEVRAVDRRTERSEAILAFARRLCR